MPVCRICLRDRNQGDIKFTTPRMRICRWCVSGLNKAEYSPAEAKERLNTSYRERTKIGLIADANSNDPRLASQAQARLVDFDAYIARRFPQWLSRRLAENGTLPNGAPRSPSPEVKLIRAHLKGLVRLHRSYTKFPPNWATTSLQLKHQDGGLACNLCGETSPPDQLHVHHIVFRSRSGTNNRNNLVVLCIPCHQCQHDHRIGQHQGEPEGVDESEDGPLPDIDDIVAARASSGTEDVQHAVVSPVSSSPSPPLRSGQAGISEPTLNLQPQSPMVSPAYVPSLLPSTTKPIKLSPIVPSPHKLPASGWSNGVDIPKIASLIALVFGLSILAIITAVVVLRLI